MAAGFGAPEGLAALLLLGTPELDPVLAGRELTGRFAGLLAGCFAAGAESLTGLGDGFLGVSGVLSLTSILLVTLHLIGILSSVENIFLNL